MKPMNLFVFIGIPSIIVTAYALSYPHVGNFITNEGIEYDTTYFACEMFTISGFAYFIYWVARKLAKKKQIPNASS